MSMSCIFKLFQTKKQENKQPELRILNPLNLDEYPNTLLELRALEGALIDHLVSIHYRIDELKANVRHSIQQGKSNQTRDFIAKLTVLKEKKQLFERRLEKVRAKREEIQSTQ